MDLSLESKSCKVRQVRLGDGLPAIPNFELFFNIMFNSEVLSRLGPVPKPFELTKTLLKTESACTVLF